MPVPDRSRLPAWARWLAQDADGTWWAYEVEPLQHHRGWYENEVGRRYRVCKADPCPDWENQLHKIR